MGALEAKITEIINRDYSKYTTLSKQNKATIYRKAVNELFDKVRNDRLKTLKRDMGGPIR